MRFFSGSLLTLFALTLLGCQGSENTPQETAQNESNQTPAPAEAEQNGHQEETDTKEEVTAKKVIQESEEAARAAGELAAETKEEYVTKLSKRLERYDDEIAALKAKGDELQGEAKEKWNERMKNLEDEREALAEKFDKLKSSSGDAWKELKKGTTKAWGELQDSFQAVSEEFSS